MEEEYKEEIESAPVDGTKRTRKKNVRYSSNDFEEFDSEEEKGILRSAYSTISEEKQKRSKKRSKKSNDAGDRTLASS